MKTLNEYQQKEYDRKVQLVKTLNSLGSDYQFTLNIDESEPDRSEISLKGIVPVYVSFYEYKNHYNFFLRHTLQFARYETEKQVKEQLAAKGIKEPQNVHVLTGKKITAWVEYLIKVYEELVKISAQRVRDIGEFEAQVLALGGRISKKDPYYNGFSGSITKNGIEFDFEVSNEGYISKKIEIYYSVENSLEAFNALANNAYKQV